MAKVKQPMMDNFNSPFTVAQRRFGTGPDGKLQLDTHGLGDELIAMEVKMHAMVDASWQDVGIKGAKKKG